MHKTLWLCLLFLVAASGCRPPEPLPVLGRVTRDFHLTDQDNRAVTLDTVRGRIFVTDFFFTSCPTICPIMKTQMARIHAAYAGEAGLILLSHSIDPEYDTVDLLHEYGEEMDIDSAQWRLLTGDKEEIYAMAKHYMLGVMEDERAPGGYIHSGSFCLVDRDRQIRGYYDGTDAGEVDQLIRDIKRLLAQP